ncbi:MAG: hypothetical protein O3C43_01400 [Verrucomicrobia bacterium]|nr:hypothetical protein [Verrucomicrobiota bacterium]MDA1065136.1 hypothetical protein [Verrucomicrobiota bacterium]
MSKLVTVSSCLVFVSCIAVTVGLRFCRIGHDSVSYILPTEDHQRIDGWEYESLPLSPTEQLTEKTAEVLGFDDFIFSQYKQQSYEFSVFAVHWKKDSTHWLEVSTHVPDNCFTALGMQILEKRQVNLKNGDNLELNNVSQRLFQSGTERLWCLYIHFSGATTINYQNYGEGKTLKFLLDNVGTYFEGNQEQYYLRLLSNREILSINSEFLNPDMEKIFYRFLHTEVGF